MFNNSKTRPLSGTGWDDKLKHYQRNPFPTGEEL